MTNTGEICGGDIGVARESIDRGSTIELYQSCHA